MKISDHFEIIRLDELFISDYKNEKENRRKARDKAEQVLRIGKNVVIDDTNHLESMRHYWFSLAVEWKSIFVIIWMKTDFQVCRSRNEKRIQDKQVPRDSMYKIKNNFEPPGGAYFEKNVLEIMCQDDLETCWYNEEKKFQFLVKKIQSKVQTAQGSIHKQDLILRGLISEVLQKKSSPDKKKLAGALSKRKSEILKLKMPDEEAAKFFKNYISSICDSLELKKSCLE